MSFVLRSSTWIVKVIFFFFFFFFNIERVLAGEGKKRKKSYIFIGVFPYRCEKLCSFRCWKLRGAGVSVRWQTDTDRHEPWPWLWEREGSTEVDKVNKPPSLALFLSSLPHTLPHTTLPPSLTPSNSRENSWSHLWCSERERNIKMRRTNWT